MLQVKLKFHSLVKLWNFKTKVQPGNVVVLSGENVLIGFFREAEVELARTDFEAEIVELKPCYE